MRHFHGTPASMFLRSVALTFACLALFAVPWAASALGGTRSSGHLGRCRSHRSQALKTTRRVIVWDRRGGTDPYSGGQLSTLYACLRPAGASVTIGQNATDGAEYVGNVATSDLRITGTSVRDLLTTGLASQEACFKYEPSNPQCATAAAETAQVFNLTEHRALHQPLAGAAVAYAFSSAGAIAWEAPTSPGTASSPLALQAVGFNPSGLKKGPVKTLDTGDLGTRLQFTGRTLQWTNAGRPESQVVSNAG